MLLDARGFEISDNANVGMAAFDVQAELTDKGERFNVLRICRTTPYTEKLPHTKILVEHEQKLRLVPNGRFDAEGFARFRSTLAEGEVTVVVTISPTQSQHDIWFFDAITAEDEFEDGPTKLAHLVAKDLQLSGEYIVSISEPQDDELENALARFLKLSKSGDKQLINTVINPRREAYKTFKRVEFIDEETNQFFEVMLSPQFDFGYRYGRVNYQWETLEHNFFGCSHCEDGIVTDTEGLEWPCYNCIPSELRNTFAQIRLKEAG